MFVIPKTMRAVVYRGVNDLRLETVPVPRTGANELLVKVAVCGVCPTDIKKIHYGTVPPPRIFGHETAGTIVKIGGGNSPNTRNSQFAIQNLKIGDRVALHHHVPCLDCHYCRHHAFAQCETYKRTGITAGFEPAGGGYAEYVRVLPFVLPGVVKIPAKNSFEEGAMLEPVNTVLKAVRRLGAFARGHRAGGRAGADWFDVHPSVENRRHESPRHRSAGLAPEARQKIRRESGSSGQSTFNSKLSTSYRRRHHRRAF